MKLAKLSEMIGGVQTSIMNSDGDVIGSEVMGGVAPIDGINADGMIWFKEIATDDQKKAAQALMDTYLPVITI